MPPAKSEPTPEVPLANQIAFEEVKNYPPAKAPAHNFEESKDRTAASFFDAPRPAGNQMQSDYFTDTPAENT